MFYLGDISLGGDVLDVLHDLAVIEREAAELGLLLNHRKSEVICSDMSTKNSILSSFPGASVVEPSDACLLGSPIGDLDCVSSVIDEKVRLLRIMGERLTSFAHDAILLLHHSFAIPKLLYTLRTSPCFLSPSSVKSYDDELRSILSSI